MWVLRWLISKTLRRSVESYKQAHKMLQEQRDLLTETEREKTAAALERMRHAIESSISREKLQETTERELNEAGRYLKPHPDSWMRETVEMFLVVFVSVIAFRAFFLQPFKIPTGSMQPTLYGITHVNLIDVDERPVPSWPGRVGEWFRGTTWYHLKAEGNWELIEVAPPTPVSIAKPWGSQTFYFEDKDSGAPIQRKIWYSYFDNPPYKTSTNIPLAFMPDTKLGEQSVILRRNFQAGDDVLKFCVKTGDHLFVDRMVYNFRKPKRGEIIVFETRNIKYMKDQGTDNQFYIKRLIGFDGERMSIGGPDFPPQNFTVTNSVNIPVTISGQEHFPNLNLGLKFDRDTTTGYRPAVNPDDPIELQPGESRSVPAMPIVDHHVRIDGITLDGSTKNFEHLYNLPQEMQVTKNKLFQGNLENKNTTPTRKVFLANQQLEYPHFTGHVNRLRAGYFGHLPLAIYKNQTPFDRQIQHVKSTDWTDVPGKGYWAMGDNTENSLDSRMWGEVPERNLIGNPFFVYWPFLPDPDKPEGANLFGWLNWTAAITSIAALLVSIWWLFRLPNPWHGIEHNNPA
ncbi:MAG: hypothetical protein CMO66_00095 [Verrucomicrobiales bacterium]|nr:hypothetical protein [Verrucomicrobiales bacterium]